ncbi:MAG: transglutaminase domain-containing protein [Planctomycetota bacterium]|nr:transglutaminase domain-containing protein [Planctomycetota bacterium]
MMPPLLSRLVTAWSLPVLSGLIPALACPAVEPTATPHTDRAVAQIRQQAAHLAKGRRSITADFFSSLATVNFVQSRLSSLNYSVRAVAKEPLPTNVEESFKWNAGICGNHVAAFLEIAQRLRLRARPVEFYFRGSEPDKNHSHICVEVFYDKRWRLFDITWGTYFRKPGDALDNLVDIETLRGNPQVRSWAVTNQSDLWYQQWTASGLDPLEYLDHARVDILRGRQGTIHLEAVDREPDQATYQPRHQPNFVGRNRADKDYGTVTVQLESPPVEAMTLQLEVLGFAGNGTLTVTSGSQRLSIPFAELFAGQTRTISFKAPVGKQVVRLQTSPTPAGGVAYVVFRTLRLTNR